MFYCVFCSGGKFMKICERIQLPDDVSIGYVAGKIMVKLFLLKTWTLLLMKNSGVWLLAIVLYWTLEYSKE